MNFSAMYALQYSRRVALQVHMIQLISDRQLGWHAVNEGNIT